MALQIQMNTIDETGTATPMYPMNRSSDVIVGLFAAATKASLPGESGNETLETSLALIKAYLGKLNNAAYMDVATTISNDERSVPKTSLLYGVNEKVKTALQTTGGEMSGYLTFNPDYTKSSDYRWEYNDGLKFQCATGDRDNLKTTTYEIKAIGYSINTASIDGGIGCNTLLPLTDEECIGCSYHPWDYVYARYMSGFEVFGNIKPKSTHVDMVSLGTSDRPFMTTYCQKVKGLSTLLFAPAAQTTNTTEVGFTATRVQTGQYSYNTWLSINTSIIPSLTYLTLGTISDKFGTIYSESIFVGTDVTVGITATALTSSNIKTLKISNANSIISTDTATLGNDSYPFESFCTKSIYMISDYQKGHTAQILFDRTGGQIGERVTPVMSMYMQSAVWCNGETYDTWNILYASKIAVHYSSSSDDTVSTAGVYMGALNVGIKLYGNYFDLYSDNAPATNKEWRTYSDEKVKTVTSDLTDDRDKLNKVLEDLNIQSYIYKYDKSSDKTIGVVAQELEKAFIENGLDPFKYGILNVQYNALINMGSEEDKKFYTKFMTVSYDQLNTLYLIKIQSLNNELQRIKDEHTSEIDRLKSKNMELAGKIAAIEARLG